jgi:hypothetical protein
MEKYLIRIRFVYDWFETGFDAGRVLVGYWTEIGGIFDALEPINLRPVGPEIPTRLRLGFEPVMNYVETC